MENPAVIDQSIAEQLANTHELRLETVQQLLIKITKSMALERGFGDSAFFPGFNSGALTAARYYLVVPYALDPKNQLTLDEARELDPGAELGHDIAERFDLGPWNPEILARFAAEVAANPPIEPGTVAQVKEALRSWVPEIESGVVTIVAISREAGRLTKVLVSTTDIDVDPVGACLGMYGARAKEVRKVIGGEMLQILGLDRQNDLYSVVAAVIRPPQLPMLVGLPHDLRLHVTDAKAIVTSPDPEFRRMLQAFGNLELASEIAGIPIEVQAPVTQ